MKMAGIRRAYFLFTICVLLLQEIQLSTANTPNIISRADWGAREPSSPIDNLTTSPVPYVIIHHSATPGCTTQAVCQARVRSFQNYHINEKHWSDIGYNFVVGEDGNIYEGRGWDKRGAHSVDYNSQSIGICVIGNFSHVLPNKVATDAVKYLIQLGVDDNKIKPDYTLLAHRQVSRTTCPGDSFYEVLKTWPHWSATP